MSAINQIQSDMLGKVTGTTRLAGPLANPAAKGPQNVDPRLLV
jgi:hypothetical protein